MTKRERLIHNLTVAVPSGFVGIAEGLVLIFTLGYYHPGWQFKFCARSVMRQLRRRKAFEARNSTAFYNGERPKRKRDTAHLYTK